MDKKKAERLENKRIWWVKSEEQKKKRGSREVGSRNGHTEERKRQSMTHFILHMPHKTFADAADWTATPVH